MAEAVASSCSVCSEDYTKLRRRISLECNHSFCLKCIGRIEQGGEKNCPLCRKAWTENLVDASELSAMSAKLETLSVLNKMMEQEILCSEHGNAMEFWCFDCKIMLCKKCLASCHKKHDFDTFEDCLGCVGDDAASSCHGVKEEVTKEKEQCRSNLSEMNEATSAIDKFVEFLLQTKEAINSDINEQNKAEKRLDEFLPDVIALQDKIRDINKENAVNIYRFSQDLVKNVEELKFLRSGKENSLIANIAKSYVTEVDKGTVDATSFVRALTQREHVDCFDYDEFKAAVAALEDEKLWIVNSRTTARAAVFAATEMKKKPSELRLIFPESGPSVPTLSDLIAVSADPISYCYVRLRCSDAFFGRNKEGIKQCKQRLALIEKNEMSLIEFFGQLDSAGLSELPHTVNSLGLAIANTDDAATVNALQPWRELLELHVFVSSAVTPAKLLPLPLNPVLCLHFWGTKDDGVDAIVEYIDSLIPDENKEFWLFFPNCLLSPRGAMRLPQLLRGRQVQRIDIEAPLTWQQSDRDSLAVKLEEGIGSDVLGNRIYYIMDWLRN